MLETEPPSSIKNVSAKSHCLVALPEEVYIPLFVSSISNVCVAAFTMFISTVSSSIVSFTPNGLLEALI